MTLQTKKKQYKSKKVEYEIEEATKRLRTLERDYERSAKPLRSPKKFEEVKQRQFERSELLHMINTTKREIERLEKHRSFLSD